MNMGHMADLDSHRPKEAVIHAFIASFDHVCFQHLLQGWVPAQYRSGLFFSDQVDNPIQYGFSKDGSIHVCWIAIDLFSIPVMSSELERIFNLAGRRADVIRAA